jgi:hypothetical protein
VIWVVRVVKKNIDRTRDQRYFADQVVAASGSYDLGATGASQDLESSSRTRAVVRGRRVQHAMR